MDTTESQMMSLVKKITSKLNDNLVAILGVCLEITSVQYCLNRSFKVDFCCGNHEYSLTV